MILMKVTKDKNNSDLVYAGLNEEGSVWMSEEARLEMDQKRAAYKIGWIHAELDQGRSVVIGNARRAVVISPKRRRRRQGDTLQLHSKSAGWWTYLRAHKGVFEVARGRFWDDANACGIRSTEDL